MPKDDTFVEKLAESIEIKIKVTPEIHTRDVQGTPRYFLRFVIQSGNETMPEWFHWTPRAEHYGPREGSDWEWVKNHWLAQYGYICENLRFAAMVMADHLAREAALAQFRDVEWEPFFTQILDHLHELDITLAEAFPRTSARDGSYSYQAQQRMDLKWLIASHVIFMDSRFYETPIRNADDLARFIALSTRRRGGDTRADEIKQLWTDKEVLKGFARKVDELYPVWTTIKGMADPCDSKEAQDEWLASVISDRPVIQDFMARYPKLTADVLRRAVDNRLKRIDRETRVLTYFHAALELEVQINDDTVSIIDAYMKYQGKHPAPTSLETFYDRGKALLNQTE